MRFILGLPFLCLLLLSTIGLAKSDATAKMFCVEMSLEKPASVNEACIVGNRLRVEMKTQGKIAAILIYDANSGISTMIDPNSKTFQTLSLEMQLEALQKSPTDLKVMEEQRSLARDQASKAKSLEVNGRNTFSKKQRCEWYQIGVSGQPNMSACVQEVGHEQSEAFLKIVALVREAEKKYFPLRLEGVPVLDVDLPIYQKHGVIKKDHLPIEVKMQNQTVRFVYMWKEASVDDLFSLKGFHLAQ